MSAQTYEWYIETTSSRRGDLVVGPWQDELAEPVVVIDRRELMAGRPSAIARRKSFTTGSGMLLCWQLSLS